MTLASERIFVSELNHIGSFSSPAFVFLHEKGAATLFFGATAPSLFVYLFTCLLA